VTILYVVETDALCRNCGQRHEYITSNCMLAVFRDPMSAAMKAREVEGIVREIERVPEGVHYVLFTQIAGKPDPSLPATRERFV
jgi:hypothetical protein